MPKKEIDMPSRSSFPARASVDLQALGFLDRQAKLENRTRQMHLGLLLNRIAILAEHYPDKLAQMLELAKNHRSRSAA